ncbi:MAG: 3-hydroxy-3-methylglutaryl-CoA reductase, partial [Candidatus Aenigmarchaeota archaeon]|nr:3-hydroxy-3-methylglutaryl-CoA reductase [Candidatus Aenigmarchaeota archaeon]
MSSEKTSKLSGFYKLSLEERLKIVSEFAELTEEEKDAISKQGLSLSQADLMIENVIGTMQIPLGVAANFLINGKDYIVPMALEEPSVIAAASNIAKLARIKGGFKAETTEPVMIGQIQLTGLSDVAEAKEKIFAKKKELLELANAQDPMLVKFGGGARDIEVREVETPSEKMIVVHLLVDCRDAMGANAVNTMAEA